MIYPYPIGAKPFRAPKKQNGEPLAPRFGALFKKWHQKIRLAAIPKLLPSITLPRTPVFSGTSSYSMSV